MAKTLDPQHPQRFGFETLHSDGRARLGRLDTPHGSVATPAFVAVGTQASVKSLSADAAHAAGVELLFANTYHLHLRPGAEVVAAHGGLHRFMNFAGPILTDSGGFQVFSLGASIEHGVGKVASIFPGEEPAGQRGARATGASGGALVRVAEDGVEFRSHIDGSKHFLTPELSIAVQRSLGADIVLAFDECTSPLHDEAYTARSMDRTHRWAARSLSAFRGSSEQHGYRQALYGIVQGGAFHDLRRASALAISELGFDGIAIGGNLGSSKAQMHQVLDVTIPLLDPALPRHLLGIGDVAGIFEAVERGVDTFDCVLPTRNARAGTLLVAPEVAAAGRPAGASGRAGVRSSVNAGLRLNIYNARFQDDLQPIEPGCDCYACQYHTRAYLRHLFKAGEQLAQQLATIHNLRFTTRLLARIRGALAEGGLAELKREYLGVPAP